MGIFSQARKAQIQADCNDGQRQGVDPRRQGGLQRWVSGTARSDKVHSALQEFLWPITLPSLMAGPPFSALTSKSERIISSAKTHGPHF